MRLGEARNQGPAAHERHRTAEDRNARQRRINEAGDSVPGSQDSLTRRFHNLQLSDSPATQTTLPAPATAACPTLADPTQTRQRQESLRCAAQCGPDPAAFKGASNHGLMLHMVQKHGVTVDNSSLERALYSCATSTVPLVFCVTQSGRSDVTAAATARATLQPEISLFVTSFKTADNLDTMMLRPSAPPLTIPAQLAASATR